MVTLKLIKYYADIHRRTNVQILVEKHISMYRMKKYITHIVSVVTACYLALEVAIPPNPYQSQLILALTILICLKHNLPEKLLTLIKKIFTKQETQQ